MHAHRGFSLIEIMLVLLVMGMVASVIVVNPLREQPAQQLEQEAERFAAKLAIASDFAVLNQTLIGVRLNKDTLTYSFVELSDNEEWLPLEGAQWMEAYTMPERFAFKVKLDGLAWLDNDSFLGSGSLFDEELSVSSAGVQIGDPEDEPPPPPELFLYPSGEIGDFAVEFSYLGEQFGDARPLAIQIQGQGFLPLIMAYDEDNIL